MTTRKPSRSKIHLKELNALGTTVRSPAGVAVVDLTGLAPQLRKLVGHLGITNNSAAGAALTREAIDWIANYWIWRKREQAAPTARSEALLLEDLIKQMENAVAECGLSFATDQCMEHAAKILRGRLEELRKTPAKKGRRRNMALVNLAPSLASICERHSPQAKPGQILKYAKGVFKVARIASYDRVRRLLFPLMIKHQLPK